MDDTVTVCGASEQEVTFITPLVQRQRNNHTRTQMGLSRGPECSNNRRTAAWIRAQSSDTGPDQTSQQLNGGSGWRNLRHWRAAALHPSAVAPSNETQSVLRRERPVVPSLVQSPAERTDPPSPGNGLREQMAKVRSTPRLHLPSPDTDCI